LSLLEVMLALAILGTTLAIIGELTRLGTRSAARARDLSTAQIHCESLMAQVVSGLIPPTSTGQAVLDDPNAPGDWLYTVAVEQVDQQGLLAVKVTVSQNPAVVSRPVSFSLGRWMIDPSVAASAASAASQTTGTQATGSSTTSGAASQ
jgi:type II secretion system protein I